MSENCEYSFRNPSFINLGYIIAAANLEEKHDRSAPSDYHWKILKCRMIIFSNSSILASPDKAEIKKIHVIFNKFGDNYDKVNSLLMKFALLQDGGIRAVTADMFQMCFQYTMTARIAPVWNTVGSNYLINNRDFMVSSGPQDGLKYFIHCYEYETKLALSAVRVNFVGNNETFLPGEWVRVLPSLNKAVIDEYCEIMPESARFKTYKELKRHWKNIHGYRLPEEEGSYYLVQFWRGDPLTYPKVCVVRNFPLVVPVPKPFEENIIARFLSYLNMKMPTILGSPLQLEGRRQRRVDSSMVMPPGNKINESQAVSLCTPTQTH